MIRVILRYRCDNPLSIAVTKYLRWPAVGTRSGLRLSTLMVSVSPIAEILVILYSGVLWTSLITPTVTRKEKWFILFRCFRFQSMVWIHLAQCWACGETEPQQGVYGRAKKVISRWREDRCGEGKKRGTRRILQRYVPCDLLPPRGPHLLKSHSAMNLSVNEWTHDRVFSSWYHQLGINPSICKSLGIISYQTITTVSFVWDTRLFLIF